MEARRRTPQRKARIAVVEPDEAVRDSLVFSLQVEGCDVLAYAGPAEFESHPATGLDALVVHERLGHGAASALVARFRAAHPAGVVCVIGHSRAGRALSADVAVTRSLEGESVAACVRRALGPR